MQAGDADLSRLVPASPFVRVLGLSDTGHVGGLPWTRPTGSRLGRVKWFQEASHRDLRYHQFRNLIGSEPWLCCGKRFLQVSHFRPLFNKENRGPRKGLALVTAWPRRWPLVRPFVLGRNPLQFGLYDKRRRHATKNTTSRDTKIRR